MTRLKTHWETKRSIPTSLSSSQEFLFIFPILPLILVGVLSSRYSFEINADPAVFEFQEVRGGYVP